MKKEMIKFPSIEQFRHIQREIQHASRFVGLDEDGKPIYDPSIELPVVTAIGTVKIHGTNAGVTYDGKDFWPQSRSSVISVENDNAGFAKFVEERKEAFLEMFKYQAECGSHWGSWDYLTIFGEFAGKGIQKGVAVNELEKAFYVFDVKLTRITDEGEQETLWVSPYAGPFHPDIKDITDYEMFKVEIDFSKPEEAIQKMSEYVDKVEKQCPVAELYGVKGIGEGIVWKFFFKDRIYTFKTKGEKHSKTRVKKLPEVDVEAEKEKRELVKKLTPSWRLDQGMSETFGVNWEPIDLDRKKMGDYIRWVVNDIQKEESDLFGDYTIKDLGKLISDVARKYFFECEKG